MNVLELLADKGVIDANEIPQIEEEAVSNSKTVEDVLAARGIDPADIAAVKGEKLNVPARAVPDAAISHDVLQYIPEESAQHYKFVPLAVEEGVLQVGVVNPDNMEALDALNFISSKINMPFKVFVISESDFNKVIEQYKGITAEVGEALSDLETELSSDDDLDTQIKEAGKDSAEGKDGQTIIKEDAPVTKIVATILRYAVEGNASDIHIEPLDKEVRVRFRVDGILETSLTLPKKVLRAVVARIKILSSMRLDERRKPQDGRFSATVDDRRIDFRVSTFPTYNGEKVVMRILDPGEGLSKLEEIGLTEDNLRAMRDAIKRPYGIIFISGPTGSGKSTTLYAMLNEMDRDQKNVLSLEDPVERNVAGVSQSQVRPEIGYTFATGLRSILRQDPDIIMVGEVRDKETAQLAIQAALTGHLVLATIHTNNSVGVIPRLVDMGVDPYLIAPTLALAVAQRLVRRLCDGTGRPIPVEGATKMMIEKEFEDLPEEYKKKIPFGKEIYGIEKTQECPNGTRGRIGAFEVIVMNKDIERAILEDPTEDTIYDLARKNGMLTMKEDAIIKAFNKVIPFEEVNTLGGQLMVEEDVAKEDEMPQPPSPATAESKTNDATVATPEKEATAAQAPQTQEKQTPPAPDTTA